MATQKQVEALLAVMHKAPPSEKYQKMDRSAMGIRAILKYLSRENQRATAGEISKALGVSTARVAVLLKKMVAKGLLEKQSDPADGRLVVVCLSQKGKDAAEQFQREIYALIGSLIDEIGLERMLEFAAISNEIHEVIKRTEED